MQKTKWIGVLAGTLVAVPIAGWLGLQVKPKRFPDYPERTPELNNTTPPADLPAPVSRFYETAAGDRIPIIESAVITGRGDLRFGSLTFPTRLRFTHIAGQAYRHYIEATIWGHPLLKANESYIDGVSRMELPFAVTENEPKVNMAANLALWGEAIAFPSIFITDPRVRWEPIDDNSARLVVPFGSTEDTLTVTFDPHTGLVSMMEAMRYREATDAEKIPWRIEMAGWKTVHGIKIPTSFAVTWLDQGTPWLVVMIEDVVFNVDVTDDIKARGL